MRVPEFSAGPAVHGRLSNREQADICAENIRIAWLRLGYYVHVEVTKISAGGGKESAYPIVSNLVEGRAVNTDDLNLAKAQGAY